MFLGIDCGTQGTKALVVDDCGFARGKGYAKHPLIEAPSGRREQEPGWWIQALRESVRQAIKNVRGEEIVALGVSGQQHGLVILNDECKVIRPAKLWNDTETAPQNEELIQRLGGPSECISRFGILPLTGYTVSKLFWLRVYEPSNFALIRHILLPHEYINFHLTGRLAAEFGDASGTGYFDPRSRTWNREMLDLIDGGSGQLFAALPPLVGPESVLGTVRPEVAAQLGLSAECVVSAGGGDNMMGAIGTGNVREGVVTVSLGTSSTVYSFKEHPYQDQTGQVAPFCSSSGGWLPLVCTMNATNVINSTLVLVGKNLADIDTALEATPPGADGLTFLPFLNGERTPDLPTARGSLAGISTNNLFPAHLIRAAVEGVTFGILNGLDLIHAGLKADTIFAIGGGARSTAWRQLLADSIGASVCVPEEEESGCLGAAMQAMVAFGNFSDKQAGFIEVAQRCFRMNQASTVIPRTELKQSYDKTREKYQHYLMASYPQLAHRMAGK